MVLVIQNCLATDGIEKSSRLRHAVEAGAAFIEEKAAQRFFNEPVGIRAGQAKMVDDLKAEFQAQAVEINVH